MQKRWNQKEKGLDETVGANLYLGPVLAFDYQRRGLTFAGGAFTLIVGVEDDYGLVRTVFEGNLHSWIIA